MQQATVNLLADMGVQPGTLAAGLLRRAPRPTPGARRRRSRHRPRRLDGGGGSPATLSGTATDAGGGRVGAVEVSVDGGVSWHPADGRETWSYTWTPARPAA